MKMEDQSTSPRDEDVLSQTQDPLERRRLQNRLSQRNHRRKIRERIAKLQERVIANELRAAAALNGWDQTYNPSLFPRAHSVPQHDHGFALRDVPPSIPDQCTPFMPLYPSFASHSWSNDLNTFPQHSGCPGDLPQFTEASEASPISPIPTISSQSTNGISSATGVGSESYRELAGTSEPLIPDSLSTSAPNQPLYYVATEAALPQIIQVINTMSPQYKVIVLVPPESQASASMNSYTPPNPSYSGNHSGLEHGPVPHQSPPQNLGCLCYPHTVQSGSHVQSASRTWMSTGQYAQMCPLHKIPTSNPSLGGHPVRML